MMTRAGTRLGLVALMLLFVAGCGSTGRPSVAEWQPGWDRIVDGIPTAAEVGEPPDRAVCSAGLGLVRSSQGGLFPTPDRAIDETVREWVRVVESSFFECPPHSRAIPDWEFAYGELFRLEAEVAAVLAIDSS